PALPRGRAPRGGSASRRADRARCAPGDGHRPRPAVRVIGATPRGCAQLGGQPLTVDLDRDDQPRRPDRLRFWGSWWRRTRSPNEATYAEKSGGPRAADTRRSIRWRRVRVVVEDG